MLIRNSSTLMFVSVVPVWCCRGNTELRLPFDVWWLLISGRVTFFLSSSTSPHMSASAWSFMLADIFNPLSLVCVKYLDLPSFLSFCCIVRSHIHTVFLFQNFKSNHFCPLSLPQSFTRSRSHLSWAGQNQMARLTMSFLNLPFTNRGSVMALPSVLSVPNGWGEVLQSQLWRG